MAFKKRKKISVVVGIRTLVASGRGLTGKGKLSGVMEMFFFLICMFLDYMYQNSLNCILKICAFCFFSLYLSKERRIWISMESTVKVSCLLIKWNDAHEVFNTMSECQASVLIWSVLYFTSVTIFSSCWSCSSMYSFLVNIILVLQTLECVKFGDSSVEMRWRWRYWDRN